jgi:hypothetical protein
MNNQGTVSGAAGAPAAHERQILPHISALAVRPDVLYHDHPGLNMEHKQMQPVVDRVGSTRLDANPLADG